MFEGFPDNFRRSDEDVLNEFRQKQVNFDLEERRSEINSSRSLFIGALGGLAMAGIVGWLVLAPQYQSNTPEELPVIRAPQTPTKMQPADPGGVEISNQEKTVYDIIERKLDSSNDESVLPEPEQPNANAMESLVEETVLIENANEAATKVESLTTGSKPVVTEVAKIEAKTEVVQELVIPEDKKEEVIVKEEVLKPVVADKVPAAKGAWQIQLMSSPNKSAVEKSWNTMVKKYSILADQVYEVEAADLGAKGMFYRLRAGNFKTKDEATSFCNKLKAAGGSCFTARK